MNRLLCLMAALMLSCSAAIFAQESDFDYVYLNNGSVIKGFIENEVENVSVTIRSVNGEIYTYKAVEVRKVAHGKDPKVPAVSKKADSYSDYTTYTRGFWFAVELQGGYSARLVNKNIGMAELDVVGGYRFNDYLKLGIGIGARYYISSKEVRDKDVQWGFPIYANVRGNFMPSQYRTVVPYYSFDLGGSIRDGVMVRPTIGIRIGEPRQAFLVGLSYLGQSMKADGKVDKDGKDGKPTKTDKFLSFVTLKIGYEF